MVPEFDDVDEVPDADDVVGLDGAGAVDVALDVAPEPEPVASVLVVPVLGEALVVAPPAEVPLWVAVPPDEELPHAASPPVRTTAAAICMKRARIISIPPIG